MLLAVVGALVGVTAWFALDMDAPLPAAQEPISLPLARAEKGDADAQLQLGMRYAEGDGVVQNNKEAAKWFALAAQQGLAEAQYRYGLALLQGRAVVQDYKAAFSWIEKTAQRGDARAQSSLGALCPYDTGTAVDKARAHLRFNLAAAQGRSRGQGARQPRMAAESRADRRDAGRGPAHDACRSRASNKPATPSAPTQTAPAKP